MWCRISIISFKLVSEVKSTINTNHLQYCPTQSYWNKRHQHCTCQTDDILCCNTQTKPNRVYIYMFCLFLRERWKSADFRGTCQLAGVNRARETQVWALPSESAPVLGRDLSHSPGGAERSRTAQLLSRWTTPFLLPQKHHQEVCPHKDLSSWISRE